MAPLPGCVDHRFQRRCSVGRAKPLSALLVALALTGLVGCKEPAVTDRRITPEMVPGPGPIDAAAPDGPGLDAFTLDPVEAGALDVIQGQPRCRGSSTVPEPASCAALGVVVDPRYASKYTCHDLGPVPGVPMMKYGGLTLSSESCSTRLLIGGDANATSGKIYAIDVLRNAAGNVSGFSGAASAVIDAPHNDGGLAFGPDGVLFATRYPVNQLQQTRPGSVAADKVIDLAMHMVASSTGSLNFVPRGLPAAGALKLVAWSVGQWYTVDLAPDGAGTFAVTAARHSATLPGGPEGFVYVAAGSPLFPSDALLVSEWTANEIAVYDIDASADPVLASRRDFVSGLRGAEGAYRDPATGDFFFSTWGQATDRVIVVRGFAPFPIVD